MIYNKISDEFQYNGITYKIGAPIIGTDESEYKGLFGTITEIRTGNDKETDNTTPDIYCSFELPLLQQEINDLEARFSELYGEKKWIEDIILDEVILSLSMIKLLSSDKPSPDGPELFIVDEAWALDGEPDSSITIFTDYDEAKYLMHENLMEDMENGIISRIRDCDKFISDEGVDFYDGYIDGEHNEDFYKIEIKRVKVNVADDQLLKLIAQRALSARVDNMAKRVFIYARAAGSKYIEENLSLQLQELIDYCHKHGYIKSRVFVDRGVSGISPITSRAAAQEMLEELPKYAVDAIVVSDMSRISRNIADSFAFRKDMRDKGISVIVVNQNFSKQLVSREEIKLAFDGFDEKRNGCIGYFRGDFGNGEQFYSSFNDCHSELKTPGFRGEFDDLIDYFRECGENPLLRSRDDMFKHIYSEKQYLINYGEIVDFCFKVVTEQHTYYFGCSPRSGDYNFRIVCYNTELINFNEENSK